MAGSVAISRFTQYAFLLDYHDEKMSLVTTDAGDTLDKTHRRTLLIAKTNFGYGKGQKLAYDFGCGPMMEELGCIKQA